LLQGKSRLLEAAEDVVNLIEQIIEGLFRARNQLQSLQKSDFHKAKEDITEQIAELVFPGFITQTPFQWLIEYPRYFKAIELRADKLPKQIQKDSENIQIVKKFKLLLKSIPDKENKVSAIKELHWMLEELRVSLFAQTLKTKMPVSEKRVLKKLEEIGR
jgi:ATP-dependent helicase HrpA